MHYFEPEKICPLCKQESSFLFLQNYDNDNRKFSLFECGKCQGQFWLPFKNPGADWYVTGDKFNTKDSDKPRCLHSYHEEFIKTNKNSIGKATILDLGCGTGEFLGELKRRGANVYGVDIDKDSIKIAKTNFSLNNNVHEMPITSYLETSNLPAFDFITMFEVFEHVDDTPIILNAIKKILKKDGKLFMSMPSRDRLFANYYNWDYPYHHLSRWNEESIRRNLQIFGYKNIKVIYLNAFGQLYELFLDLLAEKLKFKKAAGLKKIANGKNETVSENKKSVKKYLIKVIYKTGRFLGVVVAPYCLAAAFYPASLLFFPRAGIMYIEASIE